MQLAALAGRRRRFRCNGARAAAPCRRKLGQAVAAQRLERHWRKDQILEAYLNLVPFRGEVVGIDALSRTLFGKAAHGLDEREAARGCGAGEGPQRQTAPQVSAASLRRAEADAA